MDLGARLLIAYPDAAPETMELMSGWKMPDGIRLAIDCVPRDDTKALIERCRDAEAILLGWATLTGEIMAACPRLQVVSFMGVGVESYVDLEAARVRGIRVANTPGYGDRTVAEHTIALMFAVSRRILHFDAMIRGGGWGEHPSGLELVGRRIGLVGFGPIAQQTARMAQGLGLEVVAWTRNAAKYRRSFSKVQFIPLPDLFATSDVVSLHLSLNDATRGLIDAALLNRMKPEAIFINTARGPLMDYDALEKLLIEGRIFGAGLDVFPEEPLKERPLRHLKNVVLTPHVAFNSTASLDRLMRISLDNILNFFAGRPQNLVV